MGTYGRVVFEFYRRSHFAFRVDNLLKWEAFKRRCLLRRLEVFLTKIKFIYRVLICVGLWVHNLEE